MSLLSVVLSVHMHECLLMSSLEPPPHLKCIYYLYSDKKGYIYKYIFLNCHFHFSSHFVPEIHLKHSIKLRIKKEIYKINISILRKF